jgi:hypothetical protein
LSKVLIDTCVIIDHLKGVPQASKYLEKAENQEIDGLISTVTELELFAGTKMSDEEQKAIFELLEVVEAITVTSEIAQKAGLLLAQYRKSHGLRALDAVIAATALINDAVLITLNDRHFRFIQGLLVINPYKE